MKENNGKNVCNKKKVIDFLKKLNNDLFLLHRGVYDDLILLGKDAILLDYIYENMAKIDTDINMFISNLAEKSV